MDPRRAAMKEMLSDDSFGMKENPTGADMGKLFLDKALFPPDVKEGDQVRITATINGVGSKVTITPLEAEMVNGDDNAPQDPEQAGPADAPSGSSPAMGPMGGEEPPSSNSVSQ